MKSPYIVSIDPIPPSKHHFQKLYENAEEAIETYASYINSLERSIVIFREKKHQESQAKAVKERVACVRRINKRSKRRKKKSIKVFGSDFEKILEYKQREGLLSRKMFR